MGDSLGVASGLLQERPVPFQHGNIGVKSWQPMSTSWSTQLLASRILYALLVGEKQREIGRARLWTQSCSKVGQLLLRSLPPFTGVPTGPGLKVRHGVLFE